MYNCIPIQSTIEQDGNQGKAIQVVNVGVDTAGTRNYPSRKPRWERSDTGRNARSASGRERRGCWDLIRIRERQATGG